MHQHPRSTVVPPLAALLTTLCVSDGINHPIDAPERAQNRRRNRPPQPANKQCANDGGVILVEVLVRALSRVEGQHCFLGRGGSGLNLLVRGVFEGVGNLRSFAERTNASAMPEADEEGTDCSE